MPDPRFTQLEHAAQGTNGDGAADLGFVAVSSTNWIVAYDSFNGGFTNNFVYFESTTDGGTTWTPVLVDTLVASNYLVNGIWLTSLDGITIYLFYVAQDQNDTNDLINVAKSTNGGANWTITTITSGGGTDDLNDFTVQTAFQSVDNHLFLPLINFTNGNLSMLVSGDGGATWATHLIDVNGAGGGTCFTTAIGHTVMVSYGDFSNTMWFASSTDCGVTWATSQASPTGAASGTRGPLATADGNTIWIFYQGVTTTVNLNVVKSINGGMSWGSPVLIDGSSVFAADTLSMSTAFAANNSEPTISYGTSQTVSGNSENFGTSLKFAQSSDGGATWSVTFLNEPAGTPGTFEYYGLASVISTLSPTEFFVFGLHQGTVSNIQNVIIYESNTAITGAFTPRTFSCGAVATIVHGETNSGSLVHGETTSGGVHGETVT